MSNTMETIDIENKMDVVASDTTSTNTDPEIGDDSANSMAKTTTTTKKKQTNDLKKNQMSSLRQAINSSENSTMMFLGFTFCIMVIIVIAAVVGVLASNNKGKDNLETTPPTDDLVSTSSPTFAPTVVSTPSPTVSPTVSPTPSPTLSPTDAYTLLGERKKCDPIPSWPGDFKLLAWNAGTAAACAEMVEQDSDCSGTFMLKRNSNNVEEGGECRCTTDTECSLETGNSWNTFRLN